MSSFLRHHKSLRAKRGEAGATVQAENGSLASDPNLPIADPNTFTVHWHGHFCRLGNNKRFAVMAALAAKRPGWSLTYRELSQCVWVDGGVENGTIQSTVYQLKRELRTAGMASLADAITGEKEGYFLKVDPEEE